MNTETMRDDDGLAPLRYEAMRLYDEEWRPSQTHGLRTRALQEVRKASAAVLLRLIADRWREGASTGAWSGWQYAKYLNDNEAESRSHGNERISLG